MKKLKIFAAIITVELIAVLSLFIWNYTSLSHAVVWDVTSYKLTAQKVHGADSSQKEKLNQEIENYLDSFSSYADKDLLCSHSYRILTDNHNISVVEITTSVVTNYTRETMAYKPVGRVQKLMFAFVNDGEVQTSWEDVLNTLPPASDI